VRGFASSEVDARRIGVEMRMVLQIAHQVEALAAPVCFGDETTGGMAFGRGWHASREKFTWHPAVFRIVCVSGEFT
jgi:hypothetical protein